MRQHLPRAVVVLAVLHLLAAVAFGLLAHIDPLNQFPDLVLNDDAHFAAGLYANRNIGIGLALAAALVVGSRMMLIGLFIARFATDVADLIMAFTQDLDAGDVVGQLVFFGVLFASELYVITTLFRLENAEAHV